MERPKVTNTGAWHEHEQKHMLWPQNRHERKMNRKENTTKSCGFNQRKEEVTEKMSMGRNKLAFFSVSSETI